MTFETNRIGDNDLQLIDFTEEDDYLIAFPFRDSLEDFRLSVTFDNVNECDRDKLFGGVNSDVQTESDEPRRPSFLRKSLAWDSAFFNSAGVLNSEELLIINKGFKKAESNQSYSRTGKDSQPHRVTGQNPITSDSDGVRLGTLEGDLFKDLKPSIPKHGKRSKVATNIGGSACGQVNAVSCKKVNFCSQNKVKSTQSPKSQSRTLQGPKLLSSRQTAVEGSDSVKMGNKTRKAGMASDLTVSKRSRWGDLSGLPKSTSFTSPKTDKDPKLHKSYETSSSASSSRNLSKSNRRKINSRNTKLTNSPSSVHFPMSSTCSSSTSPASSIDGWFSESLSSTTITNQHTIPASTFQSQNSEERKFTIKNATRSLIGTTPPFGGPKRKIKSSGLRMPSPKIGFFDEDPIFRGSIQDCFGGRSPLSNENRLLKLQPSNLSPSASAENCLKVRKTQSREHDGRKGGGSCIKLKPDGQIPKEISKNRINMEQKKLKDVTGSFHVIDIKKTQDESDQWESQKENVFSFEDQVNGLSRNLELIDLDRDLTEGKGQRNFVNPSQLSLPPTDEHTTPCGRTPLAEKMCSK